MANAFHLCLRKIFLNCVLMICSGLSSEIIRAYGISIACPAPLYPLLCTVGEFLKVVSHIIDLVLNHLFCPLLGHMEMLMMK